MLRIWSPPAKETDRNWQYIKGNRLKSRKTFTAEQYNFSPEKETRENRNNSAEKENNKSSKLHPLSPRQMPNQFLTKFCYDLLLFSPYPINTPSTIFLIIAKYSSSMPSVIPLAFTCLAHLFPAHLFLFYPFSFKHGLKARQKQRQQRKSSKKIILLFKSLTSPFAYQINIHHLQIFVFVTPPRRQVLKS